MIEKLAKLKVATLSGVLTCLAIGLGAGGCLLVGCTSSKPIITGTRLSQAYRAPTIYQDHRDQQKTFFVNKSSQNSGYKIAYTDHGQPNTASSSAPQALVLIHGVPTSSWMYRKIIPDLQNNHRVISIDLLGFGSSDKPKANAKEDEDQDIYSSQQQAKYISELLSSLNINRYAVLMHDMGGLVTWELMREEKEKISHLVVLNTIIHDQGFNNPQMNPGIMTRQLMKSYASPLSNVAVMTKTFNDLGLVGEHELSEDECFGYVRPMREGSDTALYSFFTRLNDDLFSRLEENRKLFKGYKGKSIVMWGAKDKTLTTEQIPILQETLSIPEKDIHIYPDNGHFLAEEIPAEVISKVNQHLSQ